MVCWVSLRICCISKWGVYNQHCFLKANMVACTFLVVDSFVEE